jgi:P pilus assembly chaperone PapD
MTSLQIFQRILAALFGSTVLFVSSAHAEVVLSQLIVELRPGNMRQDVDVWNNSPEPAYVAAEPREIIGAGTAAQTVRVEPDPEKLGLLVAPARMILEPGQHKLLRFAAIGSVAERERIYRVTVKPEVGRLTSDKSGLKILVGYDVLVLVRPAVPRASVVTSRSGTKLTFINDGNVSVELTDGRQCDPTGKSCTVLPGKRLYTGARWTEPLKWDTKVEYRVISSAGSDRRSF